MPMVDGGLPIRTCMEYPFSKTRSGLGKGTFLDRGFVHAKVVIFQCPKRLIFRDPFRYPSVFKNQFLNGCQGKREIFAIFLIYKYEKSTG